MPAPIIAGILTALRGAVTAARVGGAAMLGKVAALPGKAAARASSRTAAKTAKTAERAATRRAKAAVTKKPRQTFGDWWSGHSGETLPKKTQPAADRTSKKADTAATSTGPQSIIDRLKAAVTNAGRGRAGATGPQGPSGEAHRPSFLNRMIQKGASRVPDIPGETAATPRQAGTTTIGRARDAWDRGREQRRQAAAAAHQRTTPTADQTSGMSLSDRYDRANRLGTLSQPFSTTATSEQKQQAVDTAEESEEESRKEQEDELKKGTGLLYKFRYAIMAVVVPFTALPVVIKLVHSALMGLANGILENSRNLRIYDARIANTFARLDFQSLVLDQSMAHATSGSTQALGKAVGQAREEWKPIMEALGTALNIMGIVAAKVSTVVAFMTKWNPVVYPILKILEVIEWILKDDKKAKAGAAYVDFMKFYLEGEYMEQSNRPTVPAR